MGVGAIVGTAIGSLFGALILFMVLRTVLTKPPKKAEKAFSPIEVDRKKAVEHLSLAVQIPTVTVLDEKTQSYAPFLEYHAFLEKTYPNIYRMAEKTLICNYSIILKIDGTDPSLLPGCFLAHQDVVPAPPEGWECDPFGGVVKDGFVYGRGSFDMKGHMIALMEALETLLQRGERPKRGIYFCFGHDEEYTGKDGAAAISKYLKDNNIRMEYVIDEGGTVIDGNMLGIPGTLALIGTCEKGYVDYVLTAARNGGHASAPRKRTSVDVLAEAIFDLKSIPMKKTWSQPLKDLFKALAPYANPLFKFVFVNRDILAPILKPVLGIVHPITGSLLQTTFAFTQLKGAEAPNVIPGKAEAVVNVRINIGENQEMVKSHMRKVVGKDISVSELNPGFDPSPVSNIHSEVYQTLCDAITDVFPTFIPAPFPFIAATDAKYYYKVSDNVYRFAPFLVSEDDQNRIHATNERCNIDSLVTAIQFFAHFMDVTCW